MNKAVMLSLAIALLPAGAFAQAAPPPPDAAGPPPDATSRPPLTAQQSAALQQLRVQMEQTRVQTRTRMLAALSPAHRTAVANIFGQLALTANPDPKLAAAALDNVLAPAEKVSVLNIDAAARANARALMQARRAQLESTLTADQKAQMAAREAKMQAYRQTHPRPAPDPGAVVLRTLGGFGGYGMHGRPM